MLHAALTPKVIVLRQPVKLLRFTHLQAPKRGFTRWNSWQLALSFSMCFPLVYRQPLSHNAILMLRTPFLSVTRADSGTTSWAGQEAALSELSAGCIQTQPLTQCSPPAGPNNPLPILHQTRGCSVRGRRYASACVRVCLLMGGRGGTSCVKLHPEQASLRLAVNKYSLLRAASANCHRLGSQSPSSPNRKVQGGEGEMADTSFNLLLSAL